jgi:hypothetical protein
MEQVLANIYLTLMFIRMASERNLHKGKLCTHTITSASIMGTVNKCFLVFNITTRNQR